MAPNDNEDLRETALSPEVRRIRNSIIKKFANEPLDIMAKFVKDVVENEEDTVKRLGAMAARVEILRMRISQISDNPTEVNLDSFTEEDTEEHKFEEDSSEIVITSPNLSDWVRLRIIENSEINGVRFPKGVVIDVSQEDGDRLLESGKASYVEEDEIADVKSDLNLKKKSAKKSQDPIGKTLQIEGDNSDQSKIADASQEESDILTLEESAIGNEESETEHDTSGQLPIDGKETRKIPSKNSEEVVEDNDIINLDGDTETASDPKKAKKTKSKIKRNKESKSNKDPEIKGDLDSQSDEEPQSAEDLLAGFDLEPDSSKK